MTAAKQIMINGVDVSGCNFILERDGKIKCECCHATGFGVICDCESWKTCCYKQLKRSESQCEAMFVTHTDLEKAYKAKEQECERLKKFLNEIRDEELKHLDIEWDEYETSARKYDYSNIITLVERALGEIDD